VTAQLARRGPVAVTGLGLVTPLGLDVSSTWEALIAGRSGTGPVTAFDATGHACQVAAEVKQFDPHATGLEPRDVRRLDRFAQFAMAASLEAVRDADLSIPLADPERVGVYVGNGMGGLITMAEQFIVLASRGPGRVSPFLVPMTLANMASGHVSLALGAMGPNLAPVSACATGAHAIGEAAEVIRRGDADVMIAGGAEAVIGAIAFAGFAAARALTGFNQEPETASRPFDATRDGFVMGEGAGIVVLESLAHARARGARVHALLAGYGSTADAHHATAPREDGRAAARAITIALAQAGVTSDTLGYVNAHGTSTPLNDRAETHAIKLALGDAAYRVPVSSTKGALGHLLGAAGAVEAAICVLAIAHGTIPPTINYRHADPDCDLDYVVDGARSQPVGSALTNSFGFGGHNATLVFVAP
jgi:3-oxoacyl-[acyl-carrier-protein] synthase II